MVQVQSGWVLEKLLRHILILMGKQHEKNCSYCERYTALLPRLHMARLTNLSEQLVPGDHVILARNHELMPNKCMQFSQNGIDANPNDTPNHSEQNLHPAQFKTSVIWPLTCKKVVAVSCASAHTMLVTASGDLYGYGAARNGRLGRSFGNTFNHLQAAPCKIDLPPGAVAVHVSCGDKFTAVGCRELEMKDDVVVHGRDDRVHENVGGVRRANQLFTFGACGPWLGLGGLGCIWLEACVYMLSVVVNEFMAGLMVFIGDCADDVWQPELAYLSSRAWITDISCGFEHCVFCTSSGQVYSFGVGDKGQLGQIDGPTGTLSALSRFYFLTQKELDSVWKEDQAKYVALLLGGEEYERLLESSEVAQADEGTKRVGTFLRKPVQLFRQCSSKSLR